MVLISLGIFTLNMFIQKWGCEKKCLIEKKFKGETFFFGFTKYETKIIGSYILIDGHKL